MAIKPQDLDLNLEPILTWAEKALDKHILDTRQLTGSVNIDGCPNPRALRFQETREELATRLRELYSQHWVVPRMEVRSESHRNESVTYVSYTLVRPEVYPQRGIDLKG